MTKPLGYLFWYKVGEPTITLTQLRGHMEQMGMNMELAPKAILPIDVYRRLTGRDGGMALYPAPGVDGERVSTSDSIRLALRPARETKTMLTRVVTRTVITAGRPTARTEVGDFVFHKPPRGEPERSRIRLSWRAIKDLPDRASIEAFGEELRGHYKKGLDHLDAQGVRRAVRAYLTGSEALTADKVYFLPDVVPAVELAVLLEERIGGGSVAYVLPLQDDVYGQKFVEKIRSTDGT